MLLSPLAAAAYATLVAFLFGLYWVFVSPRLNPLYGLAGPPVKGMLGNHMHAVLDPAVSRRVYEALVKHYGRTIRIRGIFPWDERLLTLDPASLNHVLKNSTIYEKPWQSRKLITSLIGEGMLAAEGQMHKRQRRVATPAFSNQNLRALVPVVFQKGYQLKDRWMEMLKEDIVLNGSKGAKIDVCHWVSRATFDVIGLAGFDYDFDAIKDESNELFHAYKDMFEVAISQGRFLGSLFTIYAPFLHKIFPDRAQRVVDRCQRVIQRDAGALISEKKRKMNEAEKLGEGYSGKDLLSLLLKSNDSEDILPEQRISDEELLHNINTFLFAGSDTSSLTITWLLYLLAKHPDVQGRLRKELMAVSPSSNHSEGLSPEELESFFTVLSDLSFLHNVTREVVRLIPPVHSSIRVATQDDEVPVSYPVKRRDGTIDKQRTSVSVAKGTFVHVPVEAFNLDKDVWGEDAWEFRPDRWDDLPDKATQQPGLFSNTLTFSGGPRSCIGLRFSMIEIKTFIYILLTNFSFQETGDRIIESNVVLTRPYIAGRYRDGSQLPLIVSPL